MRRTMTAVMVMAAVAAYGQEKFIPVTEDNKSEVIRNLASGQYGDAAFLAMSGGGGNNGATMTTYIYGDDKYLKEKEDTKRYDEFEIYETKGKDKEDVMVGLITGGLDRKVRYNELGDKSNKLEVSERDVQTLKSPVTDLTSGMREKVAGFRSNDKYFVIIGDGDYRYLDGKAIVGDNKLLVEEMKKGKPVTAITFFYELQKAGIADEEMTVKEFLSLSINAQLEMVNDAM